MTLNDLLELYERKLGGVYDIRMEGKENIQQGKAIYAASHHHFFDPLFVAYTLSRETETWVHYLAKDSLFRIPILRKYMREADAIPITRPYKQKKHLDDVVERIPDQKRMKRFMDDYPDLKQKVLSVYEADEAIGFALAGTRTHGPKENELIYQENGEIKEAGGALIRLLTPTKDIDIFPVNVDVHEKDSDDHFLDGMKALLGLRKKEKIPVEISVGKPIHVASYLKRHSKQELAEELRDDYWALKCPSNFCEYSKS
ncbi:MAG: lysophospholipid acyltransferase family protein [Candidatus Woesearchaeota archaeon]